MASPALPQGKQQSLQRPAKNKKPRALLQPAREAAVPAEFCTWVAEHESGQWHLKEGGWSDDKD